MSIDWLHAWHVNGVKQWPVPPSNVWTSNLAMETHDAPASAHLANGYWSKRAQGLLISIAFALTAI